MFFYQDKICPFTSLTQADDNLYLDKGWDKKNNIYFKGYSTNFYLPENLENIIEGKIDAKGKYCLIHNNQIYHPKLRGFPVYQIEENRYTNIMGLHQYIPQNYEYTIENSLISLDDAAEQIGNILKENISGFLENNFEKLNVIFTMGLDSMTVWAILDSITDNYNLHIFKDANSKGLLGSNREYTHDLLEHMSNMHWGYRITNTSYTKNYFITGFYSERMQIREVTTGHAIANFLKTKLDKMVNKTDYLYFFLQRSDNKINSCLENFANEIELKNYCFKTIFDDYQMWHIDNNLHFSPFYDIRIPKICYNLTLEDICKNAANGIIQKKIIERFNPNFLQLLADYKNSGNIFRNYKKNWHKIILSNNVNINIT